MDDLGITVCSVNGTDFAPFRKLLCKKGFAIPYAIITDGDPRLYRAKNKVLKSGLRRGSGLVYEEADLKKLRALAAQDDEVELASALRSHGIFVGDNTLELDLLEDFSVEMKSTYSELTNSDEMSEAFNAAADSAEADVAQAQAMLNRIESVGKGRFAQRLAGKLTNKNPPAYILNAINFIIECVAPADAKPE